MSCGATSNGVGSEQIMEGQNMEGLHTWFLELVHRKQCTDGTMARFPASKECDLTILNAG